MGPLPKRQIPMTLISYSQEHQAARPPSQHRLSMSSTPSHNLPIRHTTSRHHSHSISLGAVNPSNRVTRRKSMTSTAVNNVAAIAAAISGAEEPLPGDVLQSSRRSFTLKSGGIRGVESIALGKDTGPSADPYPNDTVGDHDDGPMVASTYGMDGSAVIDGLATGESEERMSKSRARRASEGAHLSRSEGKRSSGELRCEQCGKGYKHSSCLTKHLLVYLAKYTLISAMVSSSPFVQRSFCTIAPLRLFYSQDPTKNLVDISIGGSTHQNGHTPQSC